jgi:DNA adenine methylase
MTQKPLFIWAGGKNKMIKHYDALLPNTIKSYSEPFFGGGAMFIYIMERYRPETAFINDKNAGLISIYLNVKSNLDRFLEVIDGYEQEFLALPVPIRAAGVKTVRGARWEYYMHLRDQHAYSFEGWDPVKESATLYFLMKTGFNGLWQVNLNTNNRYGTPAGLLQQKTEVIDKAVVRYWNHLLNNSDVRITSQDWSQVEVADFTFYDPPYRDSFTDYASGFDDDEHEKMIRVAQSNPDKTIWICNRDAGDGFFDGRGLHMDTFPITYTAGRRKQTMVEGVMTYSAKQATEILLRNNVSTNPMDQLFEK